MLLPQFPGMTGGFGLRPASPTPLRCCRTVHGRCSWTGRPPAVAAPAIDRPGATIDNASAHCLETTYVRAGGPGMVQGSACGRSGPDWSVPTGGGAKTPLVNGTNAAWQPHSEHPDHTLVAAGSDPQYKAISVAGVGRPAAGFDGGMQPIAVLRRTRATRESGPLAAWKFFFGLVGVAKLEFVTNSPATAKRKRGQTLHHRGAGI
jgi:hypothetical protein